MLLGFRPSQAFTMLVLFSDGVLGGPAAAEGVQPSPWLALATSCVGSPWRLCVSSVPQGFSLPGSPESPGPQSCTKRLLLCAHGCRMVLLG